MTNAGLKNPLLPETNRDVAELLFVIEVGLRELIIETLSASGGPRWFKTLLPSDVKQKYVRGQQAERAAKWSTHIEHHPLYYIDFPDLAKVLNTNWKATFQRLFSDKDVFLGSLKSLEPIRNKLAHNRKTSEQDLTVVSAVLGAFESAIGKEKLQQLIGNCTVAPSIPEEMAQLRNEVMRAGEAIESLSTPPTLDVWHKVKNAWWFDNGFLTATNHEAQLKVAESKLAEMRKAVESLEREVENLQKFPQKKQLADAENIVAPVVSFFELYEEFATLPRGRGIGHKLEAWKAKQDVSESIQRALNSLELLAGESNE